MPIERNKISDGIEYLICCEGKDAELFLVTYLHSGVFLENKEVSEKVQVFDFGGNDNLKNYLQGLQNRNNFNKVKAIIVIRDAEIDFEKAEKQVKAALSNLGYNVPEMPSEWKQTENISLSFLLFPACSERSENGTLEDLCLSILNDDNGETVIAEIGDFLAKLNADGLREFSHEFKTKLHTYFSVTDKLVSFKIGEAAKAGAFNWNSNKLDSLRNFLIDMGSS